jgi:hypothetical protein
VATKQIHGRSLNVRSKCTAGSICHVPQASLSVV